MGYRALRDFWPRRAAEPTARTFRAATSVTFKLDVALDAEPVDGFYFANIAKLGISTFGTSLDDAKLQAQDAVESYLRSLIEHHELESEFTRLGIEFQVNHVVVSDPQPHFALPEFDGPGQSVGMVLVPA